MSAPPSMSAADLLFSNASIPFAHVSNCAHCLSAFAWIGVQKCSMPSVLGSYALGYDGKEGNEQNDQRDTHWHQNGPQKNTLFKNGHCFPAGDSADYRKLRLTLKSRRATTCSCSSARSPWDACFHTAKTSWPMRQIATHNATKSGTLSEQSSSMASSAFH